MRLKLLDRQNELLVKRVTEAMKSSYYPGPSDARDVVKQLEKAHLNKRRHKLEVYVAATMLLLHRYSSRSSFPSANQGGYVFIGVISLFVSGITPKPLDRSSHNLQVERFNHGPRKKWISVVIWIALH